MKQLTYLEIILHAGAAHDMQQLFPEGFLFTNALYGLSWADYAQHLPNGPKKDKALTEITWALSEIDSPASKAVFPQDQPIPYGMFFQGWSAYLRVKYLTLLDPAERDSVEISKLQAQITDMITAFSEAKSPFLESYPNAVWPADNVVGMAAVANAGKILLDESLLIVTAAWLNKIRLRLDPETGLIPHQTDAYNGETLEGARGSSQSLMLSFLPEIDPEFAADQYQVYEELFTTSRLGLPGVREYPKGSTGTGDID
ncbi:MAG: hypothetical protein AAF597_19230, partial [Bacteroidota bacterium]